MAWHPILLPMFAFGVLVSVQWLLRLSVYPAASLTETIKLAAAGCTFYLTLNALRLPGAQRQVARVLWLFCGLLAAEAIFQLFSANGRIYWFHDASYGTPVGPFVYHNHFGGCMDLLLPPAIAFALEDNGHHCTWADRARRGLLPALGLAAVVLSLSRGAILAISLEAALALILFWRQFTATRNARIATIVVSLALLGFMLLGNARGMVARFHHLAHNKINHFTLRIKVAQSAWAIFRQHPWLGTGFGTFAVEYPRYKYWDNNQRVLDAHDDYIQALSETGLAGAFCVLSFAGIWLWDFRKHCSEITMKAPLRISFHIAAAGFLFHSIGDFEFHSFADALLFYVVLGAALAVSRVPPKASAAEAFNNEAVKAHPLIPGI